MSDSGKVAKQVVKIDYSKVRTLEIGDRIEGTVIEIGDGVVQQITTKDKTTGQPITRTRIMIPITVLADDTNVEVATSLWINAREVRNEDGSVSYEPIWQLTKKMNAYKILKKYGAKTIKDLLGKKVKLVITEKGYWTWDEVD